MYSEAFGLENFMVVGRLGKTEVDVCLRGGNRPHSFLKCLNQTKDKMECRQART